VANNESLEFHLDLDRDILVIRKQKIALSRIEVHIMFRLINKIECPVQIEELIWAAVFVKMDLNHCD